jgi:hypothetical protein
MENLEGKVAFITVVAAALRLGRPRYSRLRAAKSS